jgi:4-alpha-glucanotransferase
MKRGSGILLHITSLPSPYGIGDMGPWAYKFADSLSETKQSFWQILPLTPTTHTGGNSPYHGLSAFAGNKLLISPDLMIDDGLLTKEDVKPIPSFQKNRVDYKQVTSYKERLFKIAYERFKESRKNEYEKFISENSSWLEDFALFVALKAHLGKVWSEWPQEIRDRHPEASQTWKTQLHDKIEMEKFLQYVFFKQWSLIKRYCNQKGIQIIGDVPIYVDFDSADVWVNPEIFKLDEEKRPSFVGGVPPDYFSSTGQLWGHPVYRWDALKGSGYAWWIRRFEHNLKLFDFVRIDHFRGLVAYWEVQATEKTASRGRWVEAPAEDFFCTLCKRFPHLPIIAEDLGTITPDVRELMNRFEFPGMRVLLFAFGESISTNPYAPHNHVKNCFVYTGTHDTNTVKGWFEKEATQEDKKRLFRYIGHRVSVQDINWEFIRLAMMSVADITIVPLQDILDLGEEARMNRPATTGGNWEWRLLPEQLTPQLLRRFLEMTKIYGRT